MGDRRLLVAIVDDEEPVRRALRRLFLSAGIDVETFSSGSEFLDSVRTQRPDCAVLDLRLPGLTGLDVQERLAAAGIRVPMVMVTGHDQAGVAERALAAGASAYLRKPLDAQTLLDAIALAVRGAEPRSRASQREVAPEDPEDPGGSETQRSMAPDEGPIVRVGTGFLSWL